MSVKTLSTEYNGFPKALLWYYRVIGVTLGGIHITQDNKYYLCKRWLRYYGHSLQIIFCIVGLVIIYNKMYDKEHLFLYNNGLYTIYYLTILLISMNLVQFVVSQLFLNSYGILMMENIAKYGFDTTYQRLTLFLFFFQMFIGFTVVAWILCNQNMTMLNIYTLIVDKLIAKPATQAFLTINVCLSLSISQYYRSLRQSLNKYGITSDTIARVRHSFVKTRKLITELDHSMALSQIVTTSHSMLTLMLEVYILSHHQKIPIMSMKTHYLANSVGCAIRLSLSCIVNGMVYDEADRLLLALEDINVSKVNLNYKSFRELMAFRTLNWNIGNGFTIGGLMPLKRTTLLSIFSFILTYAVLLIQTGAH